MLGLGVGLVGTRDGPGVGLVGDAVEGMAEGSSVGKTEGGAFSEGRNVGIVGRLVGLALLGAVVSPSFDGCKVTVGDAEVGM